MNLDTRYGTDRRLDCLCDRKSDTFQGRLAYGMGATTGSLLPLKAVYAFHNCSLQLIRWIKHWQRFFTGQKKVGRDFLQRKKKSTLKQATMDFFKSRCYEASLLAEGEGARPQVSSHTESSSSLLCGCRETDGKGKDGVWSVLIFVYLQWVKGFQ